jgi:phosphoribosylanthranilate isomerase
VTRASVFVKICGITQLEDAQAAVRYGAQALGFIFWPGSPRMVAPQRVREIVAALQSPVTIVGVFVNQTAEHIREVSSVARLTTVQLHGDEAPALAAEMTLPVIKSVDLGDPASIGDWPMGVTLLADVNDPVRRGGTGTTVDWLAAAKLAGIRPLLLAGGLNSENVADAIARVGPYGIDVSSGVERAPGVKDHDKLAALFAAVRLAEGQRQ